MSQEQARRRAQRQQEPVKYGDVFASVEGELMGKPVAPKDATLMQAAENLTLDQVQKGVAALAMQSAATRNEDAGVVGHNSMNEMVAQQGVNVAALDLPGRRVVITESHWGTGMVLGQYSQRAPLVSGPLVPENKNKPTGDGVGASGGPITIGEALEAAVLTVGDKPVEWSDAATIQAAEGAPSKLPSDKPAKHADVEGVTAAEMRNDRFMTTHPTGVAATVAAAARLNISDKNQNEKDKVPDI
ncbi:hypothetical protein NL676_020268 [Syzygium grande]|nr:hypothetical protein NL676_020268 [Syzygium grande]